MEPFKDFPGETARDLHPKILEQRIATLDRALRHADKRTWTQVEADYTEALAAFEASRATIEAEIASAQAAFREAVEAKAKAEAAIGAARVRIERAKEDQTSLGRNAPRKPTVEDHRDRQEASRHLTALGAQLQEYRAILGNREALSEPEKASRAIARANRDPGYMSR